MRCNMKATKRQGGVPQAVNIMQTIKRLHHALEFAQSWHNFDCQLMQTNSSAYARFQYLV